MVVAAGKGTRFGAPKQRVPLLGRPLYLYGLDDLARHPSVVETVLAVPPGDEETYRAELERFGLGAVRVVAGAQTRTGSVHNALRAVGAEAEAILVHDAARPAAPPGVVDALLAALEGSEAAVPVLPVADTLRWRSAPGGPDRDEVARVATPQAFRADVLRQAHAHAARRGAAATDDALLVEAMGGRVAQVEGDPRAEKVTTRADLAAAAWRLSGGGVGPDVPRTGIGLDHHRLAPGRALWLCGVEIPSEEGLMGHSDGDVALHALANAILGAAGERDIGVHFPPGDPSAAGMASVRIVEEALRRAAERGLRPVQAQVVITAPRPRLSPYVPGMEAALAALLSLEASAIAVHATSGEGLLADAMEAHAVAVLAGV